MKQTAVKKAAANQKLAAVLATREGADFSPFVRAETFASRGMARRVYLHKSGRVHHLLSEGEYRAFLKFAFDEDVIDIREQYPLPVTATIQAANELGIVHPCTTKGRVALVMTIDFMLTMKGGANVAYDYKPSDALRNPRTLAKYEIVRKACQGLEIEHRLITEESLPIEECRNLERLLDGQPLPGEQQYQMPWDDEVLARLSKVSKSDQILWEVCQEIDSSLGIEAGAAIKSLHRLAYQRRVSLALTRPRLTLLPVKHAVSLLLR